MFLYRFIFALLYTSEHTDYNLSMNSEILGIVISLIALIFDTILFIFYFIDRKKDNNQYNNIQKYNSKNKIINVIVSPTLPKHSPTAQAQNKEYTMRKYILIMLIINTIAVLTTIILFHNFTTYKTIFDMAKPITLIFSIFNFVLITSCLITRVVVNKYTSVVSFLKRNAQFISGVTSCISLFVLGLVFNDPLLGKTTNTVNSLIDSDLFFVFTYQIIVFVTSVFYFFLFWLSYIIDFFGMTTKLQSSALQKQKDEGVVIKICNVILCNLPTIALLSYLFILIFKAK